MAYQDLMRATEIVSLYFTRDIYSSSVLRKVMKLFHVHLMQQLAKLEPLTANSLAQFLILACNLGNIHVSVSLSVKIRV